jgi:hypothetical protein
MALVYKKLGDIKQANEYFARSNKLKAKAK